MGTITLTLPVAGNQITAGLHSANYASIQAAINGGLQNVNIASDAAIAVSKIAPGSANQILKTSGGVATWVTPSDVSSDGNGSTSVTNTTTETDLFGSAISIGANALNANGIAIIHASGTYLNNTAGGQTIRLKIKLGATTIWDSTGPPLLNSANTRGWSIWICIKNNGATNAQLLSGGLGISEPAAAPTAGTGPITGLGSSTSAAIANPGGTAAEDTTSAKTVAFTVIHGAASASLTMTCTNVEMVVFNVA